MTPREFGEIMTQHYFPAFPDYAVWARSQPEETRRAWATIFAAVDVRDLREAIERGVSGADIIPAYDRERTCQILRVSAGRIAYHREQRAESHRQTSIGTRKPMGVEGSLTAAGGKCLEQYERIVSMRDARFLQEGLTESDHARKLDISREVSEDVLGLENLQRAGLR